MQHSSPINRILVTLASDLVLGWIRERTDYFNKPKLKLYDVGGTYSSVTIH